MNEAKRGALYFSCLALFVLGACSDDVPATTTESAERVPTQHERDGIGPVPAAWVTERAAESEARLNRSEGGRLVWEAIEAHGGLSTWLSQGTVEFEFDYAPIDNPARRMHTFQRLDLWRSHGRHDELGEGADAHFGWNGESAWIEPNADAFPSPPRFWTTTPYYFLGAPFVMADPGTLFEQLDDGELEGQSFHLVKVSYEAGTGDSPDDYYILYLHPDTHRVAGLRYIVSYPGFFPEGGQSPEKLMLYEDFEETQGLVIARSFNTYRWNETQAGDLVTRVTASRVRFGERYETGAFDPPEGAEIHRGTGE